MAISHISIISIPVSDQRRAKRFYVEQLRFSEVLDVESGAGLRWIQLAPGGAETSIALVTWFADMLTGSLQGLVLHVERIEEAYDELAGRGVSFKGGIEAQPGGLFAYFNDPDGNGWMLNRPEPLPAPPGG